MAVGQNNGQVPVTSLPSVALNQLGYHGEAPEYSQNAQYDGNGQLLFFVIDGAIFDSEGFLIADSELMNDCVDCLAPGITQAGIVLAPGTCDRYYIISARKKPNGFINSLGYAILDLSLPSRHHSGRTGRVLHEDDIADGGALEALYYQWTDDMYFALQGWNLVNSKATINLYCKLPLHSGRS